jgi:uncharacterized protein
MNFKSKQSKFYFRLIIHDREIAVSRKYTTQLLLEKGINDIKKYSANSEILDFSSSDLAFFDAL